MTETQLTKYCTTSFKNARTALNKKIQTKFPQTVYNTGRKYRAKQPSWGKA